MQLLCNRLYIDDTEFCYDIGELWTDLTITILLLVCIPAGLACILSFVGKLSLPSQPLLQLYSRDGVMPSM